MWMIYGAYGFTGTLTAELARARGLEPVLAGRDEARTRALAERLNLPWRSFSLEDPAAVRAGLEGVDAVLHTAGPFSRTSRPMVDACLATGTHYLDITGEVDVFEAIHARDDEAREAGVVLIPGVGFDVVPTDCLAAMLHTALPDATHLDLAFVGLGGGTSPGTAKTALESLIVGTGAARIDGRLRAVPFAWREREVPFPGKPRHAMSIPWGDLSTAYHSTEIPHITTFMATPPRQVRTLRRALRLRRLLGLKPVRALAERVIDWRITGPDEAARRSGRTEVWGEAWNSEGRVTGMLVTPQGYSFTADASLCAMTRVLAGAEAGARTPSAAFGADFVTGLEGVEVFPLEVGAPS